MAMPVPLPQSLLSPFPIAKPWIDPFKTLAQGYLLRNRGTFDHYRSIRKLGFNDGCSSNYCSDSTRNRPRFICSYKPNRDHFLDKIIADDVVLYAFTSLMEINLLQKKAQLDWPILKRWDVPWEWQTVSLTSLACGLSFVLTGLTETAAIPYLGIQFSELSLDEKAELLFVDQAFTTAVVLGTLYSLTNTFQPRDDLYRYDFREPVDLKKGWLLWAGIGLTGAAIAIALTGVVTSFFNGEAPERETDALARLLPLIGSSGVSTGCLIGITGVLAPILEENVFRGFLMVSLTKWLPTPAAVLISAAVFAVAHLTPGQFPQLFILGTALGLSYAQTRNLLTPITIHALWNSGVILLLTFLLLQGYDIRELLRAT